jgi:hypothetical protein
MITDPSGDWTKPVALRWNACGEGEALVLSLPAYRPDLIERLARRLGARFCDFRRSRLIPLGWSAASLPLHALDDAVDEEMADGLPVVLHNSEALLSLVTPAARKVWFAEILRKAWPAKLLLPLVLYTCDLPDEATGRTVMLEPDDLPPETLLDRLSGLA